MYIIFLQFIVIIMNLFQDLAEKSNLLIRLQCFDRKLRLNNHIISHFKTDLPPWNFGTAIARNTWLPRQILFSEKHICRSVQGIPCNSLVCIFTMFCKNFPGGLIKHIETENQSARSNFAALKNRIMFNVSLTKTEQDS